MLAENKCGGSVFHEELCAIGTAKKRKEKKRKKKFRGKRKKIEEKSMKSLKKELKS